jgi:NADH-ubiquinone oxidoreductase chain 5
VVHLIKKRKVHPCTGANFEFDLRRIIALSTLRELGLMIITISIGLSGLAFFFYLLTHALFKTLLFTCAGAVIHSIGYSLYRP